MVISLTFFLTNSIFLCFGYLIFISSTPSPVMRQRHGPAFQNGWNDLRASFFFSRLPAFHHYHTILLWLFYAERYLRVQYNKLPAKKSHNSQWDKQLSIAITLFFHKIFTRYTNWIILETIIEQFTNFHKKRCYLYSFTSLHLHHMKASLI